jgi:hypothetical protein
VLHGWQMCLAALLAQMQKASVDACLNAGCDAAAAAAIQKETRMECALLIAVIGLCASIVLAARCVQGFDWDAQSGAPVRAYTYMCCIGRLGCCTGLV